jgi:hypothetical protein
VAFGDIAFFAPALKNINQKITTGFKFNGTVDDFKVDQFGGQYGQSFVQAAFTMKGLPDMKQTMIQVNQVNVKTNMLDLGSWIPDINQLKNLPLDAFSNLIYQGSLAGTIYDFKTNGTIATDIGTAATTIHLQFPDNNEPFYDGNIVTKNLNAGKLFNIPSLGLLNFKGKIAGSSYKYRRSN